MNIGFIGLGNMGAGMASNLLTWVLAYDESLSVFDIDAERAAGLANRGAEVAHSVTELASVSDIVFTSLPTNREVELVAGDLLPNLPNSAVWFETSTNQLESWRQLQAQAPEHLTLVDAPVTGGSEGAAAGTLTMLLGCETKTLTDYQPMLASFTDKQVRMGPSGAGYVAKLCQLHLNYLVALGIGEALMLGAKGNLDLDTLYEVLTKSCAQSYVVDSYIPKVLDGSYDPSFTLGLAHKDMSLITQLGEQLEVPLELADKVLESYQDAVNRFGAEQPHLQIVKRIEDDTDTSLRSESL